MAECELKSGVKNCHRVPLPEGKRELDILSAFAGARPVARRAVKPWPSERVSCCPKGGKTVALGEGVLCARRLTVVLEEGEECSDVAISKGKKPQTKGEMC